MRRLVHSLHKTGVLENTEVIICFLSVSVCLCLSLCLSQAAFTKTTHAHTRPSYQHWKGASTCCHEINEAVALFGLSTSEKKEEISQRNLFSSTIGPFVYLNSTVTSVASQSREIDNLMAKANSLFGHLQMRVWGSTYLRLTTKSI